MKDLGKQIAARAERTRAAISMQVGGPFPMPKRQPSWWRRTWSKFFNRG